MFKKYQPHFSSEQKFIFSTVVVGFAAGLTAVAIERSFHLLAHLAGTIDTFSIKSFLFGSFYIVLAGLLLKKYPTLIGSGIPRTKMLLAVHHGVISFKEALGKFVVTILTLASGVPLGLEAPTISISAGVGSILGQKIFHNPKRLKDLVHIACSAGIAAAFNTPIAAVIFTLEEMIGNFNARSLGPVLIGSLVASVTASTFSGENSIFIVTSYKLGHPTELLFYLGLGLACGLGGPLFVKNIIGVKKLSKRIFKHHLITPMIMGVVLTGLFSLYHPLIPGSGVRLVNELLAGTSIETEVLIGIVLLKFLASAFCYGLGMSGGILLPTMVIGAVFGTLWGILAAKILGYSDIQSGAYALVGIGAFLAAVLKTPFTSIVLVFEMTRDYRIVLPLMIANLVAWLLSEKQIKGSIYEYMSKLDGLELPTHEENELHVIQVGMVYTKETRNHEKPFGYHQMIYPDQTVSLAIDKLKKYKFEQSLIVVNRLNPREQLGLINLQDILDYLKKQGHNDTNEP